MELAERMRKVWTLDIFLEWCLSLFIPCRDFRHVTGIDEINSDSSEQRDAATAPTVGDRVPYVIIKAAKGAKVTHVYLLLVVYFLCYSSCFDTFLFLHTGI